MGRSDSIQTVKGKLDGGPDNERRWLKTPDLQRRPEAGRESRTITGNGSPRQRRSREKRRLSGVLPVLIGFLCLAFPLSLARAVPETRCAAFAGEWSGLSSCLDRSAVPFCVEEEVRFRFSRGTDSGRIVLDAMKRSGNRYISMGASEFVCGRDGKWQSRIESSQYHGTWTLQLRGEALVAELRIEPSNALARRATLRLGGEDRVPGF